VAILVDVLADEVLLAILTLDEATARPVFCR
jgi:hypothetical protein